MSPRSSPLFFWILLKQSGMAKEKSEMGVAFDDGFFYSL